MVIVVVVIVLAWFGVELLPGYGKVSEKVKTWRVASQCAFGVVVGLVVGSPIIVAAKYAVYEPLGVLMFAMLCLALLGVYVIAKKIVERVKKCGD